MERNVTLLDSGLIDARTLDRILQAVVFFADSVAVRATYEVAPGPRLGQREVDRRLSVFREQGFVRFWAHEYEVDDGGRTRPSLSASRANRQTDLVLPGAALREQFGAMDGVLRTMREQAYQDVVEGRRNLRQGTAEIVGLRNQMSSLVLSSALDQDGMLANPLTHTALTENFRPVVGESFRMAIVTDVVRQLGIGSLLHLTPEQVIACRSYSAGFRELLDQSLLATARGMDPVLTPAAVAQELVARYRAITAEFGPPTAPGLAADIGDDMLWDIVGSSLPGSIVLKYGLKALRWRREVAEARPFLLLAHLERSIAVNHRPGRGPINL